MKGKGGLAARPAAFSSPSVPDSSLYSNPNPTEDATASLSSSALNWAGISSLAIESNPKGNPARLVIVFDWAGISSPRFCCSGADVAAEGAAASADVALADGDVAVRLLRAAGAPVLSAALATASSSPATVASQHIVTLNPSDCCRCSRTVSGMICRKQGLSTASPNKGQFGSATLIGDKATASRSFGSDQVPVITNPLMFPAISEYERLPFFRGIQAARQICTVEN
jgi:hypothetical protein